MAAAQCCNAAISVSLRPQQQTVMLHMRAVLKLLREEERKPKYLEIEISEKKHKVHTIPIEAFF